MAAIVNVQLAEVEKTLADRKISLDVSTESLKWLGDAGYSPYVSFALLFVA